MRNVLWMVILSLLFSLPLRGQEIVDENTVKNANGTYTFESTPKYYRLNSGEWDVANRSIYTRQTPTLEGYKYGIWTDGTQLEIPDSLNHSLWVKISDRSGNMFKFKPVGFVRYINGDVDVNNIVMFKKTLNGITTGANWVTYAIGDGSSLKVSHEGMSIKQLLKFSQADRTALIKQVPNADYIGIVYEYVKQGVRYKISVNDGKAWAQDSTLYPVSDITKTYGGKKYWLSGVTWNAFKDTLNHPGYFIIDPTVIDTSYTTSGNDGYLQNRNATYLTARNNYGAVSQAVGTTNLYVGQTTAFDVIRSYLKFKIPVLAGKIVTSVTLTLDGAFDYSDTDFLYNIYPAYDSSNSWLNQNTGFNKFHEWAVSGTYTPDSLATSLNTSAWSSAYNNTFTFTTAGRDTVKAHGGDTLRIALISKEDITASQPTTSESVEFDAGADVNKPRLIITYSTVTLNCSLSVLSTYDSLRAHVYGADTSTVDSTKIFRVLGTDSVFSEYGSTHFGRTVVHPCSANTKYIIFARWYKGASDSGSTNKDTIYTRPDTATMTLTSGISNAVTIDPAVGKNNPTNTKFSLLDSTASKAVGGRRYFNLAGDTSLTERFYTNTQWGTVNKDSGLTAGAWQIVAVRAQNDDSTYRSALEIDSIQTAVGFDSAYFNSIDTNKVQTQIDFETFGAGDTIFIRIWDKVTNDTVKTDSFAYVSTLVRDTLTLPDSLNKKYGAIAFLKDTNNAIYKSDIDSFRTYAWQITSASGTWQNDSMIVVDITNHATNPVNTGIKLIDSARVAADCTNVWWNSTTGFQSTAFYQSPTKWDGDTLLVPSAQRVAGAAMKPRFIVDNVDSLGNQ